MYTRKSAATRDHTPSPAALPVILLVTIPALLASITPTSDANPISVFEGEICFCRSPVNAAVE